MSGMFKILGIGAVVGLLAMDGAAFDRIIKKTPIDDVERSVKSVVSPISDFLPQGIASALGASGPISSSASIDGNAISYFRKRAYPNSLPDTVGNYVFAKNGEIAGRVYYVVVDKQSGDLEKLVVGEQITDDKLELLSLPAGDVAFVNSQGNVRMSIDEETLEEKGEPIIEEQSELSLRTLREANVYDHEGRLTGRVSEVTYRNEEAQRIYFSLVNDTRVEGAPSTFSIPYDDAMIETKDKNLHIYLKPAQTAAIADEIISETSGSLPQ